MLPIPDFESSLRSSPIEVTGCFGIALSLIGTQRNPYCAEEIVIKPHFYNFLTELSFSDLKANVVGELVQIRGHVIRITVCHPLVEQATFFCGKCQQSMDVPLEDGVYIPPEMCSTTK